MADIFEQVDDALRQDRMQTLWRRYGWMVIAAAVLIVAGTAAVVGWRAYQRGAAEDRTEELAATFDATAEAEPAEAVATLTAFAEEADPGFAAIARLQAAARALHGDDRETAVALYQQVAADPEVDQALRELATILGAALTVGTTDLDALRSQLAAMEASNSPWRHLANEIIAAAAIEAGDLELARTRLTAISDDPEAPLGLRGRATELLAALGFAPEAEADTETGAEAADGQAPADATDASDTRPSDAPEDAETAPAPEGAADEPAPAPAEAPEPDPVPAEAPEAPAAPDAPQPAAEEPATEEPATEEPAGEEPAAEEPAAEEPAPGEPAQDGAGQ